MLFAVLFREILLSCYPEISVYLLEGIGVSEFDNDFCEFRIDLESLIGKGGEALSICILKISEVSKYLFDISIIDRKTIWIMVGAIL